LQLREWPELRESLAIKDTRAFAQKLESLAQAAQCNPLTDYAGTLANHAETFAVRDLEKLLAEFPALIQAIEQRPRHIQNPQ